MFFQTLHHRNISTKYPLTLDSQEESHTIYRVKRVIDGDTIELANGQKIRYIGIDTPESKHPHLKKQCFSQAATDYNRKLVEDKFVWLERDSKNEDRYGRLLRYVWVDDQLINEVLVREGFAYSDAHSPNLLYQKKFDQAQDEAVALRRGLWRVCFAKTS